MKSKPDQLVNRGYLAKSVEPAYFKKSFNAKIKLLQSEIPTERTLGARLLADPKDHNPISYLITALKIENKLYSKIEICNSLVSCGQLSIKPLVGLLGIIGTNQYNKVPQKEFRKNSYPLPRDIAGRTLVRFRKKALPELIKVLDSGNKKQLSEAIDAIGFICFYEYQAGIYTRLKHCYSEYNENELIKWKIIRSMSAFTESKVFLQEQKHILKNERLLKELERSLFLVISKDDQH